MIFDDFEEKVIYERLIIGVEEPILIKDIGEFIAKIDSGNSGYNVIHGVDFTRQGNMLLFKTIDKNNKEHQVSKQIIDTLNVNIGGGHIQERPVIELDVKFAGDVYDRIPFSVCDRSSNKEKVLISKDFVKNKLEALIDVGASNITKVETNKNLTEKTEKFDKNVYKKFNKNDYTSEVNNNEVKIKNKEKEKERKRKENPNSIRNNLLMKDGSFLKSLATVIHTGKWQDVSTRKDEKILHDLEKQKMILSIDKKHIPSMIANQIGDSALKRFFAHLQKTSDIHNAKGAQLKLEEMIKPDSVPESEETTEETSTPTKETVSPTEKTDKPTEETDKPAENKNNENKNVIKEVGFDFNNGELSFKNFSTIPCMISQYTYNTLWSSPKQNEQVWSGAADAFKENENKTENRNQQSQPQAQPQQQTKTLPESFIFEAVEQQQQNNQRTQTQPQQQTQPQKISSDNNEQDNDKKILKKAIEHQRALDAYDKMISNKNYYSLYVCLYKITLDDYSELLKGYNKDEKVFTVLKNNSENPSEASGRTDISYNEKQKKVFDSKTLKLPFGIKPLEHNEIKNILPQSLNETIVIYQSQNSCTFKNFATIATKINESIKNNNKDIFGFVVYAEGNPEEQRKYFVYADEQYWVKPPHNNNCFSFILDPNGKPVEEPTKEIKHKTFLEKLEEKSIDEIKKLLDNKNKRLNVVNKTLSKQKDLPTDEKLSKQQLNLKIKERKNLIFQTKLLDLIKSKKENQEILENGEAEEQTEAKETIEKIDTEINELIANKNNPTEEPEPESTSPETTELSDYEKYEQMNVDELENELKKLDKKINAQYRNILRQTKTKLKDDPRFLKTDDFLNLFDYYGAICKDYILVHAYFNKKFFEKRKDIKKVEKYKQRIEKFFNDENNLNAEEEKTVKDAQKRIENEVVDNSKSTKTSNNKKSNDYKFTAEDLEDFKPFEKTLNDVLNQNFNSLETAKDIAVKEVEKLRKLREAETDNKKKEILSAQLTKAEAELTEANLHFELKNKLNEYKDRCNDVSNNSDDIIADKNKSKVKTQVGELLKQYHELINSSKTTSAEKSTTKETPEDNIKKLEKKFENKDSESLFNLLRTNEEDIKRIRSEIHSRLDEKGFFGKEEHNRLDLEITNKKLENTAIENILHNRSKNKTSNNTSLDVTSSEYDAPFDEKIQKLKKEIEAIDKAIEATTNPEEKKTLEANKAKLQKEIEKLSQTKDINSEEKPSDNKETKQEISPSEKLEKTEREADEFINNNSKTSENKDDNEESKSENADQLKKEKISDDAAEDLIDEYNKYFTLLKELENKDSAKGRRYKRILNQKREKLEKHNLLSDERIEKDDEEEETPNLIKDNLDTLMKKLGLSK